MSLQRLLAIVSPQYVLVIAYLKIAYYLFEVTLLSARFVSLLSVLANIILRLSLASNCC